MIAYHNDPQIKANILAQLAEHREADKLVKGQYWEDGKGCAVGCTIHSGNHMDYEASFGIPVMLAYLEDTIFESLPNAESQQWPERFMGAIRVGSDLSLVGWQFLHWLLTDPKINPGITDPLVSEAVKQAAAVIEPMAKGLPVDLDAAWSAEIAAMSAAMSAECAAESTAMSAWSAAWSAEIAAMSAESAAFSLMADKLIALITKAPEGTQ